MRSSQNGCSGFIDVVPPRVILFDSVSSLEAKKQFVGEDEDDLWNSREDLKFFLNPNLDDRIMNSVIQDWGCEIRKNGEKHELTIRKVRRALSSYVRDYLRWRVYLGEIHEIWKEENVEHAENKDHPETSRFPLFTHEG